MTMMLARASCADTGHARLPDCEGMPAADLGSDRRMRLAAARLYLVCDSTPGGSGAAGGAAPGDRRRRATSCSCATSCSATSRWSPWPLRARAVRAARRTADRQRPAARRARGRRRRRARRPGRHARRRGARARRPGHADRPLHARHRRDRRRRAAGDGAPSWTTSAWAPCTRHPPRPGAPRSASSSSATPPRTPAPFFAIGGLHAAQPRRGARCRRRSARVVLRAIAEAADPQSAAREAAHADSMRAPTMSAAGRQCRRRPPASRPRRATARIVPRAALRPLGEDERPRALLVAIVVCALLALGVIVGAASVHDLSRHGGSLPGAAVWPSCWRCSHMACIAAATGPCSRSRRCWPSRYSSRRWRSS